MSACVSGTPSTTSFGCTDRILSNPSRDGRSSPRLTDRDTAAACFFHQFGIRQRIPVFSISSICFKKVYASCAVSRRGWKSSPDSMNPAISSDTSAALFRQERSSRSLSLCPLYSVRAYWRGTWRTLPSSPLVA